MARRVLSYAFQHAICIERPRAVSFRVEDFQPGDFTVIPVLDGFLIGKTQRRTPIDSWWTPVRVVADETDAVREAVTLALAENSRVWFQEGPGRFRPVAMNTGKPPDAAPNEPST